MSAQRHIITEAQPNALDAEQAILGSALSEPRLVTDLESLRPDHFFEPLHVRLWELMVERVGAGSPVDIVWLGARLVGEQAFHDLGGLQYLGELIEKAPPARSARGWAEAVICAAHRRNVLSLSVDLAQAARDPEQDPFDLIADAERVFGRMVQDAAPPSVNLVDARSSASSTLDEIDREAEQGRSKGYMTGLRCFDRRLRGLRPGWLVVVAGRPGMGKAQPLDAKVLLRDGSWRAMGDLRLGDELASTDGAPSRVAGLYPQGERQVFRITFSDGRSAECCAEHLWRVSYRSWEAPRVLPTEKLIEMLSRKRYRGRLWIDLASGHFGDRSALPVDPWVLGALLGDGGFTRGTPTISSADQELLDRLNERVGEATALRYVGGYDYRLVTASGRHRVGLSGVVPNALKDHIEALGLLGKRSEHKSIPASYLAADRQSRVDLLQGLMDTDGWAETFNVARFCSSSEQLALDVASLVRSLGGVAKISGRRPSYTHKGEKRAGLPSFVVNIGGLDPREVFSLARKRARLRPRTGTRRLTITSIEPSRCAVTQCIAVSHPSRLYVTDDYVVTHNTALGRVAALGAARKTTAQVVFFALEMARRELDERTLAQLSHLEGDGIAYKDMSGDKLPASERARLRDLTYKVPPNLLIDDSPILSVGYVRRRVLALKRKGPVAAVFIDYLQIMDRPDAKGRNEASVIGEMTKALKQLAREAETCVVLLSQINRGVESRDDKRPQLSDLRESGAIEQDANAVLFPYREAYYLERAEPKDAKKQDEWRMACAEMHRRMDVIAAKVRQGAAGTDHQVYFAEFDHIEDAPEDRR